LHWDHGGQPEDIVGEVDPSTMEETDAGLVVSGKIDLETERGRDVWRSVKSNRVSFSFGFLVVDSALRRRRCARAACC
jgi:phage head maturation protease